MGSSPLGVLLGSASGALRWWARKEAKGERCVWRRLGPTSLAHLERSFKPRRPCLMRCFARWKGVCVLRNLINFSCFVGCTYGKLSRGWTRKIFPFVSQLPKKKKKKKSNRAVYVWAQGFNQKGKKTRGYFKTFVGEKMELKDKAIWAQAR